MAGLSQINIPSLKKLYSGKVRDTFAVGDDKLLIVASDRISAFDVILGDPIPGKGKVLTSLTDFWFKQLEGVCPNHLTGIDPESVVKPEEVPMVKGRSCVAMRLKPILIECVARGYLIGGGWKDYCATGCVCGIKLPEGLQMGQKLPEPIFTPAAKAEVGTHDENISFERVVELYGEEIAEKIRSYTLELYRRASEYAATKGIIIADTKFEFGIDEEGTIRLMDEVCTPDSGRPTSTTSASRPRATTSSSSATGSKPSPGTRPRPLRRFRTKSLKRLPTSTAKPCAALPKRTSNSNPHPL